MSCRRLSALAGAAQAVKSAMTALDSLTSGGDDHSGGPVQCSLLAQAAGAVPEQGSLALQAIEDIENALTYPQVAAKVSRNHRLKYPARFFLIVHCLRMDLLA